MGWSVGNDSIGDGWPLGWADDGLGVWTRQIYPHSIHDVQHGLFLLVLSPFLGHNHSYYMLVYTLLQLPTLHYGRVQYFFSTNIALCTMGRERVGMEVRLRAREEV